MRLGVTMAGAWGISLLMSLPAQAAGVTVRHHDLQVELRPGTHTIIARDTLRLTGHSATGQILHVQLNPDLEIEEIVLSTGPLPFWEENLPAANDKQGASGWTRTIDVHLPEPSSTSAETSVHIAYRGRIQDAPTASPGLRFVRPDKTLGYIGEEGVYLTSETSWYPHVSGSLATFRVTTTVPAGWRAVTHGREVSFTKGETTATSEWDVRARTEALTLAANRFVKRASEWNGIEIATYVFPEDARVADQYVDATTRYLEWYTKLLGPYPFPKFAVVENFFPSGIGLPSFTLLGSGIMKRGYTQPYSLGHEVVHSWLGNSVHNHFETGNWVEGLTTYLANYYYDERMEGEDKARAHRKRMLMEYNLYVRPADDYPVVNFHHKENRVDNAIGYQKTAMVFHMLRRELGDEDFFRAIRAIMAGYTGRYADWPQVRQVFEDTSGKELSWFFTQWVHGKGTPYLRIAQARVERDSRTGYRVSLTVTQNGTVYRLRVPVVAQLEQGEEYRTFVDVRENEQTMALWVPAKPVRVQLDPAHDTFRRLDRQAMSPMLNGWVTDTRRAVLLASTTPEFEQQGLKPALDRIRSQNDDTVWLDERTVRIGPQSVLALGHPRTNPWAGRILQWCGPVVRLQERSITIQGTTYAGDLAAVLVNCANPTHPGHVGTVFFGFSPEAVQGLSRLLFFYGWDSYLVFDKRRVTARGSFAPSMDDLTVTFHDH